MAVVKVLHTADNHLDPKLTELGAKSMERRRDFLSAFQHAVNFALERRPHLFLVSGDLFDSVNPRNPPRTQVIRAFRRLHSEG
ncbi:MAG: metallophosphoesterase, partial [Thermofilum sp.]